MRSQEITTRATRQLGGKVLELGSEKMNMKRFATVALAASVGLFAASQAAEARTLALALSEDGGPVFTQVVSGGSFQAGGVVFGGIFGDFTVTVLGGAANNGAALSSLLSSTTSITNNTGVTHTLHLWVSETDYSLPAGTPLNVEAGLGGSMTQTTTLGMNGIFQAWGDNNNVLFGQPASTTGPINASQNLTTFDTGSRLFVFNRTNPLFSLTSVANFTLSGNGTANFSDHVNLTAVPEPASMVLLGSGLLGLAMSARRRRKV